MDAAKSGETDRAIARRWGIGHDTIHRHQQNAFAKLAPGRGRSGAFYEFGRLAAADDRAQEQPEQPDKGDDANDDHDAVHELVHER